MRRPLVWIALLTVGGGCASADPAAVDLAGSWTGTYTHPTTPGTLTLTITSTDDAFDGEFQLRTQSGTGPAQNFSGTVTGDRPSATAVEFAMDAAAFTWVFVGTLTNANRMQGTWESATAPDLQGTFDLERE